MPSERTTDETGRKGITSSTTGGEETTFAVVLLHLWNQAQTLIYVK